MRTLISQYYKDNLKRTYPKEEKASISMGKQKCLKKQSEEISLTVVSNSHQEQQNQVVHEVSKRQIFDHCWDLQGETIRQSSVIKLKMLTSSIASVCMCVSMCVREREREKDQHHVYVLFIVPILSNWEQITVIFFEVILRNARMFSSTAKNSLKMLNEKFMNISETNKFILVFPEAFEYLTEVSKGSNILIPLLSIVKPSALALISIVSPFKTSLAAA